MAVAINGEMIPELALNDVLYANSNPASTSRYTVKAAEASDSHKDSGLLVCTAAGSTAWTYEEGGRVMSPVTADLLQFIPRGKRNAKPEFAFKIKLVSFTRQGELFVDGPHLRYPCGLEAEAVFSKGTPLTLVGDLEAKRPDYR